MVSRANYGLLAGVWEMLPLSIHTHQGSISRGLKGGNSPPPKKNTPQTK